MKQSVGPIKQYLVLRMIMRDNRDGSEMLLIIIGIIIIRGGIDIDIIDICIGVGWNGIICNRGYDCVVVVIRCRMQ